MSRSAVGIAVISFVLSAWSDWATVDVAACDRISQRQGHGISRDVLRRSSESLEVGA